MNNNGQYFDGVPVTLHDAKFTGTFDLSDELGDGMKYDDRVTFLVTAVVGASKLGATKAGDMKRTNTMYITEAHFVNPNIEDAVKQNVMFSVAPAVADEDDDDYADSIINSFKGI